MGGNYFALKKQFTKDIDCVKSSTNKQLPDLKYRNYLFLKLVQMSAVTNFTKILFTEHSVYFYIIYTPPFQTTICHGYYINFFRFIFGQGFSCCFLNKQEVLILVVSFYSLTRGTYSFHSHLTRPR